MHITSDAASFDRGLHTRCFMGAVKHQDMKSSRRSQPLRTKYNENDKKKERI